MRNSNTARKIDRTTDTTQIDHAPAIKAIRDFANSPAMKVLRDYANSPEGKALVEAATRKIVGR